MGDKVFHTVSITGFVDEAGRLNLRERARRVLPGEEAAGSDEPAAAFSLERLLPLGAPEDSPFDLEDRWGFPVIEAGENINNRVENFSVGKDRGLFYTFESVDGPIHRALRILSRQEPELLWRVYTREENGYQTYALYRRGRRFLQGMDDREYELSRAGQWPMIQALSPSFRTDPDLHALARQYGEESDEDTD